MMDKRAREALGIINEDIKVISAGFRQPPQPLSDWEVGYIEGLKEAAIVLVNAYAKEEEPDEIP